MVRYFVNIVIYSDDIFLVYLTNSLIKLNSAHSRLLLVGLQSIETIQSGF